MTAEFLRHMRRLMGLKFPPASLQTHWEGLDDLPLDQLGAAVTLAARQCEAFPSPSQLRAYAAEWVREQPVPPPVDRSVALAVPVVIAVPAAPLPAGGDWASVGAVVQATRPVVQTRDWVYLCTNCQDSGWASFWCGESAPPKHWLDPRACGRVQGGVVTVCDVPHEWVARCPCWQTNHDVQRRLESQRRLVAAKAAKREKSAA